MRVIATTFFLVIFSIASTAQTKLTGKSVPFFPQDNPWIYLITYKDVDGTSFVINYSGNTHLITTKHLFCNNSVNIGCVESGSVVNLKIATLKSLGISSLTNKVYFHPNKEIDVAVIELNEQANGNGFRRFTGDVGMGYEVFFCGFPYGNSMPNLESYPYPFVKHAIVSAWDRSSNKGVELYLDGMNNPGFSGGPVLILDSTDYHYKVIGVVHSYHPETYQINEGKSISLNSGIIKASYIVHVEEIITEQILKNKQ